MAKKLVKKTNPRTQRINEITANIAAEANCYSAFKELLCEKASCIGLDRTQVIIDSPLEGGGRPDVQIWLNVPQSIKNAHEHLYGVVEIKPGQQVTEHGDAIAKEKYAIYRRSRLKHFWLFDATTVRRYDIGSSSAELPPPHIWLWNELVGDEAFIACFGPLMDGRASLESQLAAFEVAAPICRDKVDETNRNEFIGSIVSVARIIRNAAAALVESKLIPDVNKAYDIISKFQEKHGLTLEISFNWELEDEYIVFEDAIIDHGFDHDYVDLIDDLRDYKYALQADKDVLIKHAIRSGFKVDKVSFLKKTDESKASKEAFIQETSSLLLSRMIMIRFSEDFNLLRRYISNGGLKAFSAFSKHLGKTYQSLVKAAYDNARSVYRYLFDRKTLDWIIDGDDGNFSTAILHAMWIMARWDFSSVRGDILSGVYDRYLEPTQRKRLGEIYTRPELARYMLEVCEWNETQNLLDPTCGTGTFPVEAFDMARRKAEAAGIGFDIQDALALLPKLHGLDINEFSATLAKIQLLWHVISCISAGQEHLIKDAIRNLRVEGGISSLDTWGIPMAAGENGSLVDRSSKRGRRVHEKKFELISTAHEGYDLIIGNPPFVRVHRIRMSKEDKRQYKEVVQKQIDLSALFVYRTLKWWLKDGGKMALFLPLPITEAAYGENLRNLILQYKILEIVDLELLGNIAFHGTNIVTVILILQKVPATDNDQVKITTTVETCLNSETGLIDMSKATISTIKRKDLILNSYIPSIFPPIDHMEDVADAEQEDEHVEEELNGDIEIAPANALLTKVLQNDVPLLKKMALLPRLESIIQRGYEKRDQTKERSSHIPSGDNPEDWKEKLVMGYGVKIGGQLPDCPNGLPILKGSDTYPDSVDGEPLGQWDGDPKVVDTVRFYGWASIFDLLNTYVSREISLVPTIAPHPKKTYLQNTVYIMKLSKEFPLNLYVLSRIPQWFMIKTARSSVLAGSMRAHWFPRNLLRMPLPTDLSEELIDNINKTGARILSLDQEIASGIDALEQYLDPSRGFSKPLRQRADLITSGMIESLPHKDDMPATDDPVWDEVSIVVEGNALVFAIQRKGDLFQYLYAPTLSGNPCRIMIPNTKLKEWLLWVMQERLLTKGVAALSWFKDLPIPNNIDDALQALNRAISGDAKKEMESALDELDEVIAKAMGISSTELAYISSNMKQDPLLKNLKPAWRHTSSKGRKYVAYGDRDRY